jgi:hypothetical protein
LPRKDIGGKLVFIQRGPDDGPVAVFSHSGLLVSVPIRHFAVRDQLWQVLQFTEAFWNIFT